MHTRSTETMAEGLTRKKRILVGHKASAMRILTQVDKLFAATDAASATDTVKLLQFKPPRETGLAN